MTVRGTQGRRAWGAPQWWAAAFGTSLAVCGLLLAIGSAFRIKDLGDWAMALGWPIATAVVSAGLQVWWARTAGRGLPKAQRRGAVGIGTFGPTLVGGVAFVVWLVQAWPAS
jgi:hypothetical protein